MAAMLKTLKVNRKHMQVAAGEGFSTATDMAEYLVRKGVPFREAHAVTGGIVAFCLRENRTLEALSLEEFRTFHRAFDQDIYGRLDVAASIRARTSEGGTAPERVREQIRRIEEREP